MPERRCPTCGKKFDESLSAALPFCSSRCRDIDLGKWFDERIGMPLTEEDLEPPPRMRAPERDEE